MSAGRAESGWPIHLVNLARFGRAVQSADGGVRFDQSTCVLLNEKEEMLGSRVSAPVSAHLRDIQGGTGAAGGRWSKVLALAPRVIAQPHFLSRMLC